MGVRIHIFGASGVGCTTTGKLLAAKLGNEDNPVSIIDTDKYYWVPTFPPFKIGRSDQDTIELIKKDMDLSDNWVLTGALCGWGDQFIKEPGFDLVVFLYLEPEIRFKRIEKRERERLGDAILPGGESYELYTKFIERAAKYETAGSEMKSLSQHEKWMKNLECPILKITEDITEEERVRLIMAKIREIKLKEKGESNIVRGLENIKNHYNSVIKTRKELECI